MNINKQLIIRNVVMSLISIGLSQSWATNFEEGLDNALTDPLVELEYRDQILERSQISYRAESTGPGVTTYGVIISCVEGKISLLKSLYDPQIHTKKAPIRQIGQLDSYAYLTLWKTIFERNLMTNTAEKNSEFVDPEGYKMNFYAIIGDQKYKFHAKIGSSLHDSTFLTLQRVIDQASNITTLWESYYTASRK